MDPPPQFMLGSGNLPFIPYVIEPNNPGYKAEWQVLPSRKRAFSSENVIIREDTQGFARADSTFIAQSCSSAAWLSNSPICHWSAILSTRSRTPFGNNIYLVQVYRHQSNVRNRLPSTMQYLYKDIYSCPTVILPSH